MTKALSNGYGTLTGGDLKVCHVWKLLYDSISGHTAAGDHSLSKVGSGIFTDTVKATLIVAVLIFWLQALM